MKKLIFTLLAVLSFGMASGQTNTWMNIEQEYYKAAFNKSGVYRLSYNDLRSINSAITNFRNIQLFVRGVEITKRFSGIEDGSFDEGDYLEFYLKANEGEQDSVWYRPFSARPKVKSNLFSDDTFLFVTIGKTQGLISQEIAYKNTAHEENWHIAEDFYSYTDEWSFNNFIGLVPYLQQSYFERAESWTGKLIMKDSLAQKNIKLYNFLREKENDIEFSALLYTRSRISHQVDVKLGERALGEIRNVGFDHFNFKTTVGRNELQNDDSFIFSTQSNVKDAYEAHSWSNLTVKYPQLIDMKGLDEMVINLSQSDLVESTVKILNGGGDLLVYDISDPLKAEKLSVEFNQDNTVSVYINRRGGIRKIFVSNKPLHLEMFKKVVLKKYDQEADYIIITHTGLLSAAENYKVYRSSEIGGGHKVLVVDVAELYDQFNYGELGPSAIRYFLDYQHGSNTLQNRYLLLLGRAMSFPLDMKLRPDQNLVPTVGYPASDNLLSAGLHGTDINFPLYRTGRINANTSSQVLSYLEKVKEFEKQGPELWRKNILHLNGGSNQSEINYFKQSMESLAQDAGNTLLNPTVEHLVKQSIEPIENVNISKQVNDGVGLISFVGHASPTAPDFNIGYASDVRLGFINKGKYPLMYFNGCGVGNIFYRYETLSTDWLLAQDKGGIAVLANSFWSYSGTSQKYLKALYKNLYNSWETIGKSIGEVQNHTIKDITGRVGYYDLFDVANVHQIVLQGDPALKILPLGDPDYEVSEKSIQIRNADLINPIGEASQLRVTGAINNLGLIKADERVDIKAEIISASGQVSNTGTFTIDRSSGDRFEVSVNVLHAIKSVKVTVDPENKLTELSKNNNTAEIFIDWNEAASNNLYPFIPETDKVNPVLMVFVNDNHINQASNVFVNAPRISFDLKDENLIELEQTSVSVFLRKPGENVFSPVSDDLLNLKLKNSNTISGWMISPSEMGNYSLMINGKDKSGNSSGQPIYVNWEITSSFGEMRVVPSPNPGYGRVKFSLFNVLTSGTAHITLTDIQGKVVLDEQHLLQEGMNQIFVNKSLGSGTYIYEVTYEGRSFVGKLIIY